MPRNARALGEDGSNYQGPLIRNNGGAWAIFQEAPSEEFPNGAYVIHRWLPYILGWLPVTRHATQEEALAHMETLGPPLSSPKEAARS